jgi:hypothetical protein
LVLFCTELTACAHPYAPLDKAALLNVRRIMLIGPQEPIRYPAIGSEAVLGLAAGSVAGGAVGAAAVSSAIASAQYTDFDAAMRSVNLQMGKEVRVAITQALVNDSYDVTENVVPRYGANPLSNYDKIGAASDANVDVWIVVGYVGEELLSNTFDPLLVVNVRLVDAKTAKRYLLVHIHMDVSHQPSVMCATAS